MQPEKTGCQLDYGLAEPFAAGMLSMTPVADDLTDAVTPLFMPPNLKNGLGRLSRKRGSGSSE